MIQTSQLYRMCVLFASVRSSALWWLGAEKNKQDAIKQRNERREKRDKGQEHNVPFGAGIIAADFANGDDAKNAVEKKADDGSDKN